MHFKIDDLDDLLFFEETEIRASEHPHLFFQWIQVKMMEKLQTELLDLKEQMKLMHLNSTSKFKELLLKFKRETSDSLIVKMFPLD